jgi:hypothetical protein
LFFSLINSLTSVAQLSKEEKLILQKIDQQLPKLSSSLRRSSISTVVPLNIEGVKQVGKLSAEFEKAGLLPPGLPCRIRSKEPVTW